MAGSGRIAGAVGAGRRRAAPAVAWADATVVGRLWRRLLEMEFVERSIALAAKAFVSLLPLVIVIAAFLPDRLREGVLAALVTRFGLSGESFEYVKGAFASPEAIKASTSVVGLLLTVLFAVSFTTAVQRVYLRAWRRPASGAIDDKRRALVWLAGTVAFLATVGSVGRAFIGLPGTLATVLLSTAGSVCVWWWSAHTFLRGHVRWRPLLPTALVTGIGAALYTVAASVWMPTVLEGNVEQFGFVGVGMSFVTWFVGFGFLLVGAAAFGPASPKERGLSGVGCAGPTTTSSCPAPRPRSPAPLRRRACSTTSAAARPPRATSTTPDTDSVVGTRALRRLSTTESAGQERVDHQASRAASAASEGIGPWSRRSSRR